MALGIKELDIKDEQEIVKEINKGSVFIYPTDTVYGLGCDATDVKAVERIKQIKQRDRHKPLSIIAPSKQWIKDNCILSDKDEENMNKYLPGAYTLILKKKNEKSLKHVASGNKIGVRIPDCQFNKIVKKADVPFITTSVNMSGEKPAVYIDDVTEDIINNIDVVVKGDERLSGKPSTLIIDGKFVRR